jgi:ubiquinone/menaquinone biosynthesis C-methylase UbiE
MSVANAEWQQEYAMNHDDVIRCWDENADTWAEHVRAGYDTCRLVYNNPALFGFAGDLSGLQVLDAGCGEGFNTRLLAQTGAKMTGIDLSEKMIELARAEEHREPRGICYEVASMTDMSIFADDSFEAIISTMAIMDCADYCGSIREFRRVLKPNGLLAFNIIHPCFQNAVVGWEMDARGKVTAIRIGDYFDASPVIEQWKFHAAPDFEKNQPFTVPYFRRTMTEYINTLCDNGFRIAGILEPRPSDEACKVNSGLKKHQMIPQSLCIKARKE